jgi:hypothetical protein
MTTVYDGPYNPGYTATIHGTIINGIVTMSGSNPWSWTMTNAANEYDEDNDGIMFSYDKCPGTIVDNPIESLGTNRLIWNGIDWMTKQPKTGNEIVSSWATMDYAYGCSCNQILDSMQITTGEDFGGHYKFGCSKSILEDWNRGTYHVGPTFVETVEVPANNPNPTESVATLNVGTDYFLKAYGTAYACNQPGCVINFDADYSTSDLGTSWVNGVAAPYDTYGADLLDLKVDNAFVDWGVYNNEHMYQIPYPGTGNPLSLLIYDLPGSYFNDTGSIFVDIIEDLWIPLW